MRHGLTRRLSFWKDALLRPLGVTVASLWSLFSFAATLRDNLLTPETQSAWSTLHILQYLPQWGWEEWLIGLLIITLIFALEGSYRLYERERAKKESPEELRNELLTVKRELAQQKAREWQPLTNEQQHTLHSFLIRNDLFPPQARQIRIMGDVTPGCPELAGTLSTIFQDAGWDTSASPLREISPNNPHGTHLFCPPDIPPDVPFANEIHSALLQSLGPTYGMIQTHSSDDSTIPQWLRVSSSASSPYAIGIFIGRKPSSLLP